MKWSLAFAAGAALLAGAAQAAVNLNTAQQSELQRTRGLDKHKAKAIIDYRNQNGPFESLEELENVRGFDHATIEKLKPQLALSGPPWTPPPAPEKPEKGSKKK
jgi:competence protein ComEA